MFNKLPFTAASLVAIGLVAACSDTASSEDAAGNSFPAAQSGDPHATPNDSPASSAAQAAASGVVYDGSQTLDKLNVGHIAHIAVVGSWLYLASAPPAGASSSTAMAKLFRCEVDKCATTIVKVDAPYGLRGDVTFGSGNEGVVVAYGGAGNMLGIAADGTLGNLGQLSDVDPGLIADFAGRLVQRAGTTFFATYQRANHGDHGGVAVVTRGPLKQTLRFEVAKGGEVSGYAPAATKNFVFALGRGTAAGASKIVNAPNRMPQGSSHPFYADPIYTGSFAFGFTYADRVGGIGQQQALGSSLRSQVLCDAEDSCEKPSIIANDALPKYDDAVYIVGVVGNQFVWNKGATQAATTGTLFACPLETWGTKPCVPRQIGGAVPFARLDLVVSGNDWLYVTSDNKVARIRP